MTETCRPARNVLFVIIDQLRADCLHGALAEHVALPNLRDLKADAVTFTRHYSVTNPCGPSRASILTGQYAMNHRSVRNGAPLRHDTPNIATEMRKAGYLPMLFGYTDTSQDPRAFDANDPALKSYEYPMTGFQEVVEMRQEMSFPWRSHLMNRGYAFDDYTEVYKPVAPGGGKARIDDPALYAAEDSDTAFLTDRFLDTMASHHKQSWFAHLTYFRPHPPLVAPAPFNDMYDPATLPLPERLDSVSEAALHPFLDCAMRATTASSFVSGFEDLEATDETVRTLRAIYLGLASEVDTHLGRVIDWLKKSGQYEDTLLVVTADHGEMLGDRHSWGKMTVFEAAYHTPLIIRMPGNASRAGTVVSAPTESIDVMPTILEWVGQEVPNSVDGRSLLPLLSGAGVDDWREFSFSELDFAEPLKPTLWQRELGTTSSNSCLSILRNDRFTLVEFAADLPPLLFDMRTEGEMANVAELPEYQADLHRMTRALLRHRMHNMDHTLSMTSITAEGAIEAPRHPT